MRRWLGAAALVVVCTGPLAAQDSAYVPPRASHYADVTGWPDFTGVWDPDRSALFGRDGRIVVTPKLTPAAQAQLDAFRARQASEGVDQFMQVHCIPPGMPGIMRQPYPIEFLFSPGRVTVFAETYSQARRITVDPGRTLPTDPDPLFNGTSVGHWEGDTLVVDTVGFNPYVTYMAGVTPSGQMRIHEHFWLSADDVLWVQTTITDPGVLAEPFVQTIAYRRQPDWEIREYVCNENNRLVEGEDGANVDLGLEGTDDPFGPPRE
ncbi:hypothetical protein GRI62_13285 [Erythrobacter arachoides]|uniref:DUF1329 domain-containing protein n=1 Tax=Aurantiacibacter arachoides TaxID=1850444 RepID=A0A845A205_9SPHN|nr:hypothetical protein [Aurantiacibacter arachoides]MXO94571.1 hypothetical protein [Aurantiacibacter arachoides]